MTTATIDRPIKKIEMPSPKSMIKAQKQFFNLLLKRPINSTENVKAYINDIEGDGLQPTKMHCVSFQKYSGSEIKSITSYENMVTFYDNVDVLIGHSFVRFDMPVVNKLLDPDCNAFVIDTLPLAWYLFPGRRIYKLESFGPDYGFDKDF